APSSRPRPRIGRSPTNAKSRPRRWRCASRKRRSNPSSPRRRGPRRGDWIPACVGMTKNEAREVFMTTAAENEILTRVGPGTPMGELMRQYWIPGLQSSELKADGDPVRFKLLGEELIAF